MRSAHKQRGAVIVLLGIMALGMFGFVKVFAQAQQNATTTPAVVEAPSAPTTEPAVLPNETPTSQPQTSEAQPAVPPSAEPSANIAELGASAGLGTEVVQEIPVPQADPSIQVTAKVEVAKSRSNKEGLGIVRGDVETRPEEFLFFQQEGTKKETIRIEELIDRPELTAKREKQKEEGKEESISVEGTAAKTLTEVKKRQDQGEEVQIDVENI